MRTRIGVAVISAALVLYIVLVAQRAWLLLISGSAVGVTMGVALVFLPALAVWALGREVWFGARATALGRSLEVGGALPTEDVLTRPSGRVLRSEGDAVFPTYRAAVEDAPDDWRAWYRLGLAYDASGDRRRARQAIRRAIALESSARRAGRTGGAE